MALEAPGVGCPGHPSPGRTPSAEADDEVWIHCDWEEFKALKDRGSPVPSSSKSVGDKSGVRVNSKGSEVLTGHVKTFQRVMF
eukprot:g4267.t1